jgi:hypothetical protein
MSLIDAAMYHTLAASRLSPGTLHAASLRRRADDLGRGVEASRMAGAHGGQHLLPPPLSTRIVRANICEMITQALEEVFEEGCESELGCRESGATLAFNARRFHRRGDDNDQQRPTN